MKHFIDRTILSAHNSPTMNRGGRWNTAAGLSLITTGPSCQHNIAPGTPNLGRAGSFLPPWPVGAGRSLCLLPCAPPRASRPDTNGRERAGARAMPRSFHTWKEERDAPGRN
jgi:hypothetical protein